VLSTFLSNIASGLLLLQRINNPSNLNKGDHDHDSVWISDVRFFTLFLHLFLHIFSLVAIEKRIANTSKVVKNALPVPGSW